MSDLNWGDGSWEECGGLVRNTMQELVSLIKGNGREGMQATLNGFISEYRENRKNNIEFQDKRDKEDAIRENRRWQMLTALLTILSIAVAALIGLEAHRQLHGKYSAAHPDPVVSYYQPAPQDARTPHMPPR